MALNGSPENITNFLKCYKNRNSLPLDLNSHEARESIRIGLRNRFQALGTNIEGDVKKSNQ